MGSQRHQLHQTQIIWTSLLTKTMPTPHHSIFYKPDALPDAQTTASKHWRQCSEHRLTYIFIHVERLDVFERQFATFTVVNEQLVRADRRAACETFNRSDDNVHVKLQKQHLWMQEVIFWQEQTLQWQTMATLRVCELDILNNSPVTLTGATIPHWQPPLCMCRSKLGRIPGPKGQNWGPTGQE